MRPSPQSHDVAPNDARSRIIACAAQLIASGGSEAATTRAVASAASVQAPVIYRLFGDKDGLLDAVCEHVLSEYVAAKTRRKPADDPVEDLRQAWDVHVAFGLAHPAVFVLINAGRAAKSGAVAAGLAEFRQRVSRVARAGRLRVSEQRAVDILYAIGTGTILTLLRKAPTERGDLSEAARETAFDAVIAGRTPSVGDGSRTAAVSLAASLEQLSVLTPGEAQLMMELLKRIADAC